MSSKHEVDFISYQGSEILFDSPIGLVGLIVKTDTSATPPGQPDKELQYMMAESAMLVPLGIIAPPVAAGGIIIGAGLGLIGGGSIYGSQIYQLSKLEKTINNIQFPLELEKAINKYSIALERIRNKPAAIGEIKIRNWGVVSTSNTPDSEFCFFVDFHIKIVRNIDTLLQESLSMTESQQTLGLPPPQCASLGRFIEDNGQLVQDSARVYAEVLAVEIRNRVKNLKP